ncbi:MAG: hypothetical protein AAGN35_19100 [Bacteroidota bacterium]
MRNSVNQDRIYKILFFALPVLYLLLYGFHGFCDTDQGFIPGMAYRITLGEMPVRDFIYVRPPLSPFLHTLELWLLPDRLEMLGSRFLFFVFVWLSVRLSLASLARFLDFGKLGVSPWVIGGLAFVMAVHNYPPMPWHTLDGILMAALGIYLATRGPQWYYTIFGLSLMGLAALAKQPYGVVPLAGVGLLFILYPWKSALVGTLGALGVGVGLLIVLEFMDPNANFIEGLLAQATGATSFNDLRYGAYQLYVRPVVAMFGTIWLVWLFLRYGLRSQTRPEGHPRAREAVVAMIWLSFMLMFAVHVVWCLATRTFIPPRMGFYHTLLFTGGWFAFVALWRKRDRKAMAVLLVMALVNWASGISWGFSIPVLYAFPGLFGIVYYISFTLQIQVPRWYYPTLWAVALVTFFVLYQYPYRDAPRAELNYHLGDVFPKLTYVYSNQDNYDKHADFKALHARLGDNFTVLPAMPLANYLTDTKPVIQIDWAHDGEINYEYGFRRIMARMEERRPYVLVEKEKKGEAYGEIRQYRCSLLKEVLENWQMVEETRFFEVYRQP